MSNNMNNNINSNNISTTNTNTNNNSNSNNNSPRRLFIQTGGAAATHVNLPYLFTSSHLGLSNEIDVETTTALSGKRPSPQPQHHNSDYNTSSLLMDNDDPSLINKSIADLFFDNANITSKKRAGYAKNVIETAPSMRDDGGAYFLDDEDYDNMDEDEDEDEQDDSNDLNDNEEEEATDDDADYDDDLNKSPRKQQNKFTKIANELNEQLKKSPNRADYMELKRPMYTHKNISPRSKDSRASLKTGLSMDSTSNSSSSSSNNNSTRSSIIKSTDALRMDPNYKWLLKDLKLSNNKRVIDVTDLIDLNEKKEDADQTHNDQDEHELADDVNKIQRPSSRLIRAQSDSENYDETKNDNSFISKLYNKLVSDSVELNDKTVDSIDDYVGEDTAAAAIEAEGAVLAASAEENKTNSHANKANDSIAEIKKCKTKKRMMTETKQQASSATSYHVIEPLIDDNDEDDEECNSNAYANHNDSVYQHWSKNPKPHQSSAHDQQNNHLDQYDDNEYETNLMRKNSIKETSPPSIKQKQFSKSFEVSLDDLDNLIDRVDNGIKLKRSKEEKLPDSRQSSQSTDKGLNSNSEQLSNKSDIAIESLKQEWSQMFNKLENDYKIKLDEQQKQNELRLKQLHDEIKQSIVLQQQSFNNNNNNNIAELHKKQLKEQQLKEDELKTTLTIESKQQQPFQGPSLGVTTAPKISSSNSSPSTTISNNTNGLPPTKSGNYVDTNSKYISNLRMELKSKHSRHVQDLKEYYEKELDELKRKLSFYENQQMNHLKPKNSSDDSDNNSINDNEETNESAAIANKQQQQQQQQQQQSKDKNSHAILNNELKNSNSNLLDKLYESSQHIRYLTQENGELTNKVSQLDNDMKQANEKITNLEHCCTQLELQLTETIKLQDQYIRELHAEKRNLVKKMQECEELKMSCKFYEQKCDTYELKLDEKDSVITRLKTQLIQAETDLNRLEYEYKKSLNSTKLTQQQQEKSKTNSTAQQLTIKNQQQQQQQQQHQIPVIITNSSSGGGGSASSSSSMSPSSPNSMSRTVINGQSNKQTSLSTSCNNNSSSMTQLNSQRLNYPNDTISPLNTSISSNLLITDSNNDQNGSSSHRQYQFDRANNQFTSRRSQNEYHHQFRQSRNMSISPSRFMEKEREELNRNFKSANPNSNLLHSTSVYSIKANHKFQSDPFGDNKKSDQLNNSNSTTSNSQNNIKNSTTTTSGLFKLVPDIQLKYIEHLECEFDMLMKHKQQLDAQLTRLPFKTTNSNMHTLRQSVENELTLVEKKLASVKLELRKLNIIKTH